jgi:hypothetical protein
VTTRLPPGPHLDLLLEAVDAEAGGQRALLAGDVETARPMFEAAARRYRASFECAPPASYGRLVGMLKAAVIAGDPADAADYARVAITSADQTPTASYVRAIVALIGGEDDSAADAARPMRAGDPAFGRAADAVEALARRDATGYREALTAIIADFAGREDHLTGVPIADTAVMLESFAEARGMACHPASPLMPATA